MIRRRPFSLTAVGLLAVIAVLGLVVAVVLYRQAVIVTIVALVLIWIARRRVERDRRS